MSVDEDKQYAWPAYVANLRARIRCPVHLLVITLEESVARWARKPIELGGGSRVITWVKGPRDIPLITDQRQAEEHVELAQLLLFENISITPKLAEAVVQLEV